MTEEFLWKHSRSLKRISFPQLLGQEQQKIVLIFPGNIVTQLQILWTYIPSNWKYNLIKLRRELITLIKGTWKLLICLCFLNSNSDEQMKNATYS